MIDIKRRTALKMVGGSALLAAAPVMSAGFQKNDVASQVAVSGSAAHRNPAAELSVELLAEGVPTVKLTNHSSSAIELRHIHPGIVHAGSKAFDLNSIFKGQAYKIEAGQSREFSIGTTQAVQSEAAFPRHQYRNKPQRVVTVTGRDNLGEFVNSSRSFFA